MPWKKGRKFRDPDWKNAPKETAALYLLSRQVYIDVVGSGLLYRFRKFYFSSPTTMLNYLWVINPRHKDAIRTIQLDIALVTYLGCFAADPARTCGRPFEMLAAAKISSTSPSISSCIRSTTGCNISRATGTIGSIGALGKLP
jgi:hypothetical protein